MMVRPRRQRRVGIFPNAAYYKPAGVPLAGMKEVIITFDELEAIRLTTLQNLSQIDAAQKMGISQPTIHRLILNFEKKIADALINGKAIRIEGGEWIMPISRDIGTGYNFGRRRSRGAGAGQGMARGRGYGRPQNCRCPNCGTVVPHIRGVPCVKMKCPKCNSLMVPED